MNQSTQNVANSRVNRKYQKAVVRIRDLEAKQQRLVEENTNLQHALSWHENRNKKEWLDIKAKDEAMRLKQIEINRLERELLMVQVAYHERDNFEAYRTATKTLILVSLLLGGFVYAAYFQ